MKDKGLKDGRKIPDEVMEHFRRRAVHLDPSPGA
ncbi:hypothetical protein Nhal_3664 [Nitrosococcus halophilus Nc 4]|uniref:Uncharacterized protein n=1 Tax=Nitrosococcus halophilus (strain Nc4) TaxID=472759 RepID=D5C2L1_NITHN|nr:hypothetical protein Nhal_3664 [Nitrosococcus halophilus Nc 4]